VHGVTGVDADDYLANIIQTADKRARINLEFTVILRKAAGLAANVAGLKLLNDCPWCEPVRGQLLSIKFDPDLTRLAADDLGFGDVIERLKRILQLSRNLTQAIGIVVLPP